MTLQTSSAVTDDPDALAASITQRMTDLVADLRRWRQLAGHEQADVGFGLRPAVIVIDLARFWTEEGYPAYSPQSGEVLPAVNDVLGHARAAQVPVVFTTQAYQSQGRSLVAATGMDRKFPSSHRLVSGSREVELNPALELQEGEHLLVKTQSSAFAHTHLASMLHHAGVDTLIVTGMVSSGCVRATAADSIANGFRTIVVPECIGDIIPGATEWTLFDVSTKIGDVVPLAEVNAYLDALGPAATAATVASAAPAV